jgi:hypothetical protein
MCVMAGLPCRSKLTMKQGSGREEVIEMLDYEKQLWQEVKELEAELEEEHIRRPKDQVKIRTLTSMWSDAIRRWSGEYDRNHRWDLTPFGSVSYSVVHYAH